MRWLNQFHLTTTEKKAFVTLSVLFCVVLLGRVAIAFWPENNESQASSLSEEIAVFEKEQREKMLVPHRFDPNKVSEDFIASLVLSKYAKQNWIDYLAKNRRFYSIEKFQNLYGLDSAWFAVNQDSIFIGEEKAEKTSSIVTRKFQFDPNLVSQEQMLALGFPDWLANRVLAYRNKGGKFNEPSDLQKIYDFPEDLYRDLEPFISIQAKEEVVVNETVVFAVVELNSADSLTLLAIKGIGPAFANRIINYRNQLGGFATKSQLLEVYGFDLEKLSTIKESISVDAGLIAPININTEEFKTLLKHPYLDYTQVKSIVGYREKIGPIKNIADLEQLEGFTEKDIERLKPYLSVK